MSCSGIMSAVDWKSRTTIPLARLSFQFFHKDHRQPRFHPVADHADLVEEQLLVFAERLKFPVILQFARLHVRGHLRMPVHVVGDLLVQPIDFGLQALGIGAFRFRGPLDQLAKFRLNLPSFATVPIWERGPCQIARKKVLWRLGQLSVIECESDLNHISLNRDFTTMYARLTIWPRFCTSRTGRSQSNFSKFQWPTPTYLMRTH